VEPLLFWSRWSDREIARRCGVSHPFVGKIRSSLETITSDPAPRTYVTKHGTKATSLRVAIRDLLNDKLLRG